MLNKTILPYIVFCTLLASCGDSPQQQVTEQEPVDVHATQQINDKLLSTLRKISDEQSHQVEDAGKDSLEALSEADRQSLINLTIDESAKAISEDSEKVVELLGDINGVSE